MTLESDLSDKSDVSDKMGASRYTPWVCCAAVWFGSGDDVPQGYATGRCTAGVCNGQSYRWGVLCLLDGNGGVHVAGA